MTLHGAGVAMRIGEEMSHLEATADPYALWKTPNYRNFAGSWFLITFSRRIEFFAIGYYLSKLYATEQASFAMAMLGLVLALPVILLAIPGGQLADRFSRHRVMLISFSLGIVSAAGLVAVALTNGPIWWYYVLMAVEAVGWALGNPSRQAMLANLVPPDLFSRGVAWNSTVFYAATVTGPVAGGALVWFFASSTWGELVSAMAARTQPEAATWLLWLSGNMAPAFILVLLCRIVAIASIARIKYVSVDRSGETVSLQTVVAGIRFVWRTQLILATLTLDLFAVLLGGAVYLLPIFAKDILHVGPLGLGALQAADAVGAICMAVVLAHRPPLRRAGVTLLWAVFGFGVATIVFGLSKWFWLSLLMMFTIGALDNISVVVRHTLVQMLTPDKMRGRVSAVNGIFIVASNELGGLESGLMAWCFSPVTSVVVGGVGTIIVVLAAVGIWPQLRKIGSLASIRPAAIEEPDREI
jgi:MFS family permease